MRGFADKLTDEQTFVIVESLSRLKNTVTQLSINLNIPAEIPGGYLATEIFSAGRQVFKSVNYGYLAGLPDPSC